MNRINHLGGIPLDPKLGRTNAPGNVGQAGRQSPPGLQKAGNSDFQKILQKQIGQDQTVRFSAHALGRLDSRNIELSKDAMGRLTKAVDQAEAKGARDALVLMPGASRAEDLALVVSVRNRTVITAVDGKNIGDSVFTNIDSAVVAR